MNEMYNKIEKVPELIEMLTLLRDGVDANLSPQSKITVIEDVYPESAEFVINEAIEYLKSMIVSTPVKTSNFKLTYIFDGCKFRDVVNATDEQSAFDYLCWINNDDLHFVKAEICNDLPSYWCPVGWVEPDPAYVDPEVAQYSSLIKSLEVAGIKQHDYYTPELDKIMRQSLGYTRRIVRDTGDDFGLWNFAPEIYVEYTRQDHYTLRVKIKNRR